MSSGKVEVMGWDRSEVEVRGSVGEGVDRVDVMSARHSDIHPCGVPGHA